MISTQSVTDDYEFALSTVSVESTTASYMRLIVHKRRDCRAHREAETGDVLLNGVSSKVGTWSGPLPVTRALI